MTVIALNKCNVQLQRGMFNECRLTKKKSKSWAKKLRAAFAYAGITNANVL